MSTQFEGSTTKPNTKAGGCPTKIKPDGDPTSRMCPRCNNGTNTQVLLHRLQLTTWRPSVCISSQVSHVVRAMFRTADSHELGTHLGVQYMSMASACTTRGVSSSSIHALVLDVTVFFTPRWEPALPGSYGPPGHWGPPGGGYGPPGGGYGQGPVMSPPQAYQSPQQSGYYER